MSALNRLAWLLAFVLLTGEIARFWGSARFIPLALDELFIAAALAWAAWRSRRDGPIWHLAAWSAFCGSMLVLLVETAGHQIHGPAKQAGPLYLAALTCLLLIGLWAGRRAFGLLRHHVRR
jgi:hypothetical protein